METTIVILIMLVVVAMVIIASRKNPSYPERCSMISDDLSNGLRKLYLTSCCNGLIAILPLKDGKMNEFGSLDKHVLISEAQARYLLSSEESEKIINSNFIINILNSSKKREKTVIKFEAITV